MHSTLGHLTAQRVPLYRLAALAKRWSMANVACLSVMLLSLFGLAACEPEGTAIAESQYAAALVGNWQGSVDNDSETISFQADGGFTATLVPQGFISSTLSQGTQGNVFGTWALQGKVITLAVESAENEQLLNLATTSTIVAFNQNKLVVSDASGASSTFIRVK